MKPSHSPENPRPGDYPIEPALLWCWSQRAAGGEVPRVSEESPGGERSAEEGRSGDSRFLAGGDGTRTTQ